MCISSREWAASDICEGQPSVGRVGAVATFFCPFCKTYWTLLQCQVHSSLRLRVSPVTTPQTALLLLRFLPFAQSPAWFLSSHSLIKGKQTPSSSTPLRTFFFFSLSIYIFIYIYICIYLYSALFISRVEFLNLPSLPAISSTSCLCY